MQKKEPSFESSFILCCARCLFQLTSSIEKRDSVMLKQAWHYARCLFQFSKILDGANHLRSVRVLIVVPSNNLNE